MRPVLEQTLDELEQCTSGEPAYNSFVVTNAHRLRRVPLKDYTVGDLRFMILQAIGLPYLIPLALVQLEADPLVEGDHYPGDVLSAVLHNPAWLAARPHFMRRVVAVARLALDRIAEDAEADADLRGDITQFLERVQRDSPGEAGP